MQTFSGAAKEKQTQTDKIVMVHEGSVGPSHKQGQFTQNCKLPKKGGQTFHKTKKSHHCHQFNFKSQNAASKLADSTVYSHDIVRFWSKEKHLNINVIVRISSDFFVVVGFKVDAVHSPSIFT